MKKFLKVYLMIALMLIGYKFCGGILDSLRDQTIHAYINSDFNPAIEAHKSGRMSTGKMSPEEFSLAAKASSHITVLRFIFLGISIAGNMLLIGVIAVIVIKKGSVKHGNE